MSWDILFCAAATPPPPVAEMPSDWRADVIGPTSEVRRKISEVIPDIDWSDPEWGLYDADGFSLEFNCAGAGPTDGFTVHVRGGGDALAVLLRIAARWGWYLLDTSQGEWIHHCEDPGKGWKGFQTYRDSVLSPNGNET